MMGVALRYTIGGGMIALGMFVLLFFDWMFTWPHDKLLLRFGLGLAWCGWGISIWVMELVIDSWHESLDDMQEQRDKWRSDVMKLQAICDD